MTLRWPILAAAVLLTACGGASSQVARESLLQPEGGRDSGAKKGSGTLSRTEGTEPDGAVMVTPAPQQAENLAAQGLSMLRSGQLEEGSEVLSQAVATGYAKAVVYYNLAVAQVRLGDVLSAGDNAQVAVKMSRGAAKSVELYGSLLLSNGQSRRLLSVLDDVVQDNPDSLAASNMMARAKIALGKAPEGLRDASQLLKKDQTNTGVMKTIARAYLAMRREEAAKLVLHQTLDMKRDAEVLDLLGQMAARQGDKRKAIAYFQEAVEIEPDLADVHNNLGVLYHEAGDYESALREFETAVSTLPSYSVAHMNMGNSYRKMLNFPKAETAYRVALRIDPDCADCYFNLGVAALENKGTGKDEPEHYRKALEHFNRYKGLLRGPPRRGDEAEKYMDEARRMADYLEKEAQIQEAPPDDTEEFPEEESESGDDEEFEAADDDDEEWVD